MRDRSAESVQGMLPVTTSAIPAGRDMSGAITLLMSGLASRAKGNLTTAITMSAGAVQRAQAAYGSDHAITASCLCLLERTLSECGQPDAVESVPREALSIRELTLPEGDPGVAVTLVNPAACLRERRVHEGSVGLLRRAIDIEARTFGPEYDHTTTPLGKERCVLDELCEQASLLEALAACRMAVRRVLEAGRAKVREDTGT